MTIDELTDTSTIQFPKSLTLKNTKKLLDYIATNLPAEIRYTTESLETIYYSQRHLYLTVLSLTY